MKKVFFILLMVIPLFVINSCKKDNPSEDKPNEDDKIIIHHGLVYKTVINPITGKTWLDRNLGATRVATSPSDMASYGYLYQWGRGTDGHEIRTSDTTSTLSNGNTPGHGVFITAPYDWRSQKNDNLWQGVSGTNNPCPNGYRLPTEAELDAEPKYMTKNSNSLNINYIC